MGSSARTKGQSFEGRYLRHVFLYAAAVTAVSVSFGARSVLSIALGPSLPVFSFFGPAVIAVAFLAGTGPGLAATAASVLETVLWIFPARHPSADQVTRLLLFCAVGILASVFAGLYRRAHQRTALKKEQSALKVGEAHFSTMFHLSPVSMSLIRMSDGKCSDVNQAHVDLFGFAREEAIGHTGPELRMWVDHRDRERLLRTLAQGQRVSNFEADLRRKQGDIVTTLVFAEVIQLGGESFLWMMHSDITERKRTEEKFRLVVERAPMGLMIVNREGRVVLANAQAERQFGYSRSELMGSPIEDLIPERVRQHHREYRREFLADPQPRAMGKGRDLFGLRKDGTEFPVEIGLTPIEMSDGTHVMASIIDISERRRIEGALRESDIALRTLVDAIPGMALLMDTEGTVLAANKTIAESLGIAAEQWIGRQAYAQLPPDLARSRKAHSDECVRTGKPRHYEDRRLDKDFDNYVHPIKDDKGNVTRLAVLSLDITERKKAEAKVKEQAALLDIASDAILAKDLDGRIL
ncbi:MAG TPA: PAS domain S-box protein, partial [Spirochaetia bacterium]|nr:PAS domain S-box protein [Spirochaetia bacterium]